MNKQKGSALIIEMMIVLVILAFVLAIPVPNLAKLAATNAQTNALQVIQAVNLGEGYYFRVFQNGYQTPAILANANAGSVGAVAPQTCDTPGLLGANFASAFAQTIQGYTFTFTGTNPVTAAPGCTGGGFSVYTLTATPISKIYGSTSFFTDQTSLIRYSNTGAADATSALWSNQ